MKKTFKRTKKRIRRVAKNCLFCKQKISPDYKETDTLNHYVNERGKIIPVSMTGICQKHQRRLATSIKQARYLSLLPFLVRPS